ncbi:hypothetical protein [Roseobacter sp.]|uniref:hypothetical protein n=1 Tax=Roseobacter sp. TaxID=1907202 RepID=UPI00385E9226
MTVPTDNDCSKVVDLSDAFAALDGLPNAVRVQCAMQLASQFLEYAAYEMALDQGAGDVSEIIHMAARLDQAAQRIDDKTFLNRMAQNLRKI